MNEDHSKPDQDAVDLYSKTQGATDGRKPSGQNKRLTMEGVPQQLRDGLCKMARIGQYDYVNSKL